MPLTKDQADRVYSKLPPKEKRLVDRAMNFASKGDFTNAHRVFIDEASKIGWDLNRHDLIILRQPMKSAEAFRRNILGYGRLGGA